MYFRLDIQFTFAINRQVRKLTDQMDEANNPKDQEPDNINIPEEDEEVDPCKSAEGVRRWKCMGQRLPKVHGEGEQVGRQPVPV